MTVDIVVFANQQPCSLLLVINPQFYSGEQQPLLFCVRVDQCRNVYFWLLAHWNSTVLVIVIQEWIETQSEEMR